MSELNSALEKAIALKDQLSRFWNEYTKQQEFEVEGVPFRIKSDSEFTVELQAGDGARKIFIDIAAGALVATVKDVDHRRTLAKIKAISVQYLKEQLAKIVKKLKLNENRLLVSLFVGNGEEQAPTIEVPIAAERRKEFITEFKQMMEKYK